MMWATWHEAKHVQSVCQELKGEQAEQLDGKDQLGLRLLSSALSKCQRDQASLSVLKKGTLITAKSSSSAGGASHGAPMPPEPETKGEHVSLAEYLLDEEMEPPLSLEELLE